MNKLTIGMACFDDFEGVFFTIQSLRLNNLDILEDLDLIVIDNNPEGREGKAVKDFASKAGVRYFPETSWRSTACRDLVFQNAEASFALCMDPHVLLEPGTIKRLLAFIEDKGDSLDLYSGAMLYDYLGDECPATHFKMEWRENMWGIWGHDDRGKDPEAEPFEIPAMGLGLFLCRVQSWPGFHPLLRGFGGEEGVIHEKIRNAGGKNVCLPWLRWVHRFQRPRGISYPLKIEERIRNYCIGFLDAGLDPQGILDHFKETHPGVDGHKILLDAKEQMKNFGTDADSTLVEFRADDVLDQPIQTEPQIWNDTQVTLGSPLEMDVKGIKLSVRSFGISWAS